MELHHLRHYVAVAENLSFTKAAVMLHVTQPALTRTIQNLEGELGVRLLDRTKRRVLLTEEGSEFLVDSKRVLSLVSGSIQSVQRLRRGEDAELKIAYCAGFDFAPFAKILTAYQQDFPQVMLNLRQLQPADQMVALTEQRLDLGFIGLPPKSTSSSLEWTCIAHLPAMVVMSGEHAQARRAKVRLADLKSSFFVSMTERVYPGLQAWMRETCQQVGFSPRVLLETDEEVGLMSFVAAGLGVSLLAGVSQKLAVPGVVVKPVTPKSTVDYCLAWNRSNNSKALRQFIQTAQSGTELGLVRAAVHAASA